MKFILVVAWLGLISPGTASSAAESERISMVGMDEAGNAVTTEIPAAEYLVRLTAATEAVASSAFEALGKETHAGGAKPWKVRTAVVGVGAEVEVGVGSVLKLKAVPRFRLAFSDSDDPALP